MQEDLATQLNQELSIRRPWGIYAWVKVLVIFWEGTDSEADGFREEGRRVAEMFEDLFSFEVEQFAIPLSCSARRLRQCILGALTEAEELTVKGTGDCLLIIHYGGHGDRDDDHHQGQQRKSVWAASAASDSAVVEWYTIQEELKDVHTDVLLFLDCCFAAQAARDRDVAHGRVELLAAAAMGVKTRLPGPRSFTHALTEVMQKRVQQHGSVNISAIATDLSRLELNLETPVHLVLRRGLTDSSIRLVPFSTSHHSEIEPGEKPHHAALRLLVKISTDVNLTSLVTWLRSDRPPEIASVQAERVVNVTSTIKDLITATVSQNHPVQPLASISLNEIVAIWARVPALLEQFQKSHYSTAVKASSDPHEPARIFLQSLKAINESFVDNLEQRLLQSSQLHSNESLDDMINNEHLQLLGIARQLRLRSIIAGTSYQGGLQLEADPEVSRPNGLRSIIEYKTYGRDMEPSDLPTVEHRVHLLVDLLNAPKSRDFRALECARWYHEPDHRRFALKFVVPSSYRAGDGSHYSTTLFDVICQVTGRKRPSLGQRFALARTLAKAVQKWHALGWVHQSISSRNVLLFYKLDGEIDYGSPFLQGFDFARPNEKPSVGLYVDNVDFNVYRHPDRQGPARQGHRKVHDLYSLGVVLLEIGLWETASKTAGSSRHRELATELMYKGLKDAAANRLAHYAGKGYQEAVSTCLEGVFGIDIDDRAESRLAQAFYTQVLEKLNTSKLLQ